MSLRPAAVVLLLICALALPGLVSPAQPLPPGIEVRHYQFEPTGEQLEYDVFVSHKVRKDRPSPLVIALHGGGAPPQQIMGMVRNSADQHGYIVAAPMGYRLDGWYGYMGAPYRANPQRVRNGAFSEQDVMNVVELMRAGFNIDDNRIYIVGSSMGGAGALYLAMKYPGKWAAIAAASPGVLDEIPDELPALRATPILIIHGDRDNIVPIERVNDWVARMKQLGVPVKYWVLRGGAHGAALPSNADDIFRFFDQHRMEPAKH